MRKAVIGILANESQAENLVRDLQAAGFSNEDISVLFPRSERTTTVRGDTTSRFETPTDYPRETEYKQTETEYKRTTGKLGVEKHSKAPEGGATGAALGGIIGGSLGLLAGIGALAIPGFGPFIAAGPILAALSGSAIGGSIGLVAGWLVGLGFPEFEAKKYEKAVKEGNSLVCVHVETTDEVTKAKEIFKRNGVKEISTTAEKAGSRK